jgi:hypothetical protein
MWDVGTRVVERGLNLDVKPAFIRRGFFHRGELLSMGKRREQSAPGLCFLYPDFQFDRSGAIREDIAELLAVLPSEDDRGGWRRTFWLYSPHALLDDRTPAEIFVDEPTRVIAVAREEFLGDREAIW